MKSCVANTVSPVSSRSFRYVAAAVTLALTLALPASVRAGDYALTFANGTQYVSTPVKVTTASFTFEAWVKVASYAAQNWVFTQYVGGNAGRMVGFIENTNACFFLGGTYIRGTAAIPLNTWTHFAVTRSGNTGSIYINGVLYATGAIPTASLTSYGITIGGYPNINWSFHGQIADVRALNFARTQAQIAASMNSRLSGTESGLVGYWPINDGEGTSVNELVANADGTMAGTPVPAWVYSSDLPLTSFLPVGSWTAADGGNWSDTANWLANTVPYGDAYWANFTNQPLTALAITNDLSPLLLGRLTLANAAGDTFSGNAMTFTNGVFQATISATAGSHAFDLPLVLGGSGLGVESLSASAVDFNNTLSGPGALAVNPAASGGGTVTLAGANTYTGPTTFNCGTLSFNTVADAGTASPLGAPDAINGTLLVGPGTLRFTGGTASTDRGYTVTAPNRAAVIRIESGGDLTFGGRIQTTTGGQVKTGPGTVRYTFPGLNTFSSILNNDALLNIGANGDGPSQGFYSFGIAEGRVVLGAPGQTNNVSRRLVIGLYSTTAAAAETAGELEVTDGLLNLNNETLAVGRSNGTTTTAPGGLHSKLIVSGGVITNAAYILLGYNGGLNLPGFNACPEMEMSGGTAYAVNLNIGYSSGSRAQLNMSGGTLTASGTACFAMASDTVATCTLSGDALLQTAPTVDVAIPHGGTFATATLYLNGGTLQTRNVVRTGNGGSGTVYFNGGMLKPNASGQTLQNMSAVYVSTNGATFDTSLADYTVRQDLLHDPALVAADGGLTKTGTGTLTLSGYGSTYDGPTLVSGGTLCVAGALPAANTVTVGTDGEFLVGGSATQTVYSASLTLNGSAALSFAFTLDGTSNDHFILANPPTLAGKRIGLYQMNTRLPFTKNGTYALLTYSGADPDTTGLAAAAPAYGKTYTFAASDGTLTVTIASDTATASIWNVDASGDWSTGANWSVAPASAAGTQVRFDDAITSPATVTTAGETVGTLYFNNPNTYTLVGSGLTLDGDTAPAAVTVETGAHTLAAPLTLGSDALLDIAPASLLNLGPVSGATATLTAQGNGTLALTAAPSVQSLALNVLELGVSNTMTVASPVTLQRTVTVRPALSTTTTVSSVISGAFGLTKAGSSTLSLEAGNTYTGPTTVSAGTLTANTVANGGQASSIGASSSSAANWILGPATFRYAGPSVTINRGYTVAAGNNPVRAAVLKIDNDLTISGPCASWSGAFIKTGTGTLRYTYPGVQTLASVEGGDGLLNIGANGDSPTAGFYGYSLSNGKVIMGVPGQTNTINCRITIGLYTTTAPGAETVGELEFAGGVLNCNTTLSVGRGNGTTVTAPGGISSRLTVNGGIANINLLGAGYASGVPTSTFNARPVIDLNAGTVNVASDTRMGDSKGSVATLNVRGGTLRCLGQYGNAGLTLGGAQADSGTGILNLMGTGVVDIVHNVRLGAGSSTPGTGTLNLAGGTLIASNIVRGAGAGTARFNGGTFFPRSPNRTMTGLTAAYVSTNGAVFDTTLADGFTVAQNLLHDPDLEAAADGGLVKLGTNSLSLTATANTFNGPVDVRSGLLLARLGGTNDLSVATNAFFDALGDRCTVGDLTGSGTLTNGIIAVTGALDAGTNGAPAGAKMTVQNLSLVQGSTFVCDWSTNSVGQVTNDFVTVTGTLAPEGAGLFDLGRTEANPIPMPFTAAIMSYGSLGGSFTGWKAANTGLPPERAVATVVTTSGNVVILEIRYGGTLILIQ